MEEKMKIGFIGCGNMGSAMIKGILDSKKCAADDIIASAASEKTLDLRKAELGIRVTPDNRKVAEYADILFLTVKPKYYESVIKEIAPVTDEKKIIVTVAPGKTLAWLEEKFGKKVKIIRSMPNTPAMVKEGMMALCPNAQAGEGDIAAVMDICSGFSGTETVSEDLMDVVTAVSGSSPAYVFMFIEAMADAAVADGMPRAAAYRFASQTVLGSAKMVLDTGKHPGELKDMVCSPGGTTMEAVRVLEEKGFRSAVFEAMKACVRKAKGT